MYIRICIYVLEIPTYVCVGGRYTGITKCICLCTSVYVGQIRLEIVLVIKEIPCSPVTQRNSKTDLSLRPAAGSLDANFATPRCTRSTKHSPRKYLAVSLFRALGPLSYTAIVGLSRA